MSTPTRDIRTGPTPGGGRPGHLTTAEFRTQPEMWRRAAATSVDELGLLPRPGERVLVLGCGTSFYIGEAYARRRVASGQGPSRAAVPSELDGVADDEVVLLVSRSGTTGDLVTVAKRLTSSHRVVAVAGTRDGIATLVDDTVLLDYADEASVMQTRFATTSLALLRRSLGEDIQALASQGERAMTSPLPMTGTELDRLRHVVFLGTRWSAALAQEAALKVREAAGFWTEAYPLFEYQHGPISCAGESSLVWALCDVPASVAADITATGAKLEVGALDAQAELVRVHRLAVELAFRGGRDPDLPRHLSRSVEYSEL